ncbi:MAG: ATPase, partial [Rhodospirillales bacterium]
RADQPVDLTLRQNEVWQPLLDWSKSRYGAGLVVTAGITAVEQPPEAMARFADAVNAQDDFAMAALSTVTALTGSLVIALALSEGHLSGRQAFEAAVLDETFQIERWGLDYEAEDRRKSISDEILAAERFLQLYRAG